MEIEEPHRMRTVLGSLGFLTGAAFRFFNFKILQSFSDEFFNPQIDEFGLFY